MKGFRQILPLVLGSRSARRISMLDDFGLHFTVLPGDTDENAEPNEKPEAYLNRVTTSKCDEVIRKTIGIDHPVVLCADTIVCLGDRILKKPLDRADARRMLETLSGRVHKVKTCFILRNGENRMVSRIVSTEVLFKTLRDYEIDGYLQLDEYSDKAGSYAIQGQANFMIKEIRGSYTNVIGLPLAEVIDELHIFGVIEHALRIAVSE